MIDRDSCPPPILGRLAQAIFDFTEWCYSDGAELQCHSCRAPFESDDEVYCGIKLTGSKSEDIIDGVRSWLLCLPCYIEHYGDVPVHNLDTDGLTENL